MLKGPYFQDGYYHTATAEDGRIGIVIPCAGHYRSLTHHVQGRTMDEFQIVYLAKGGGWVESGNQRLEVGPGDVFFVFPHIKHTYRCHPGEGWDVWWAHFQGDYAERLMKFAGFSPERFLASGNKLEKIRKRLARIVVLYKTKPFHYHIDASMELAGILTDLKTLSSHERMRHPTILDAVDYRAEDIDALASRAGYSKYHFIRRFKQVAGVSPWDYLLRKRIDKAKELLAGGRMPVREVAYAVGFQDPDYFSKIFHRRAGMTPLQFRKGVSDFLM